MRLLRCSGLVLGSLLFTSNVQAEPVDKVQEILAAIDAILARDGARRLERTTSRLGPMCGVPYTEPGSVNRDFLCDQSTLIGSWTLKELRATGGGRVSAELEARQFQSKVHAETSKATALERYGKNKVPLSEGGISWCSLDVFWTEDVVFMLRYDCSVSLLHVKALKESRTELLKASEPFENTGIVGVSGSHSGWSWLIDRKGARAPPLKDADRFRHFVKVASVPTSDVPWLRERPVFGRRIDTLSSSASCIPVVFAPPNVPSDSLPKGAQNWMIVKFNGHEGWVNRQYLSEQPAAECVRNF